jgi:hypothetical protein
VNVTEEEYQDLGKFVWRTYVPKRGQATTVQGELLRANEKLRDESQRNGNINWDEGHEILATDAGKGEAFARRRGSAEPLRSAKVQRVAHFRDACPRQG